MSLKLESLGVKPFPEMHAFRAWKTAQWLEPLAATTPEFHLWDPRSVRREKKEISSGELASSFYTCVVARTSTHIFTQDQ